MSAENGGRTHILDRLYVGMPLRRDVIAQFFRAGIEEFDCQRQYHSGNERHPLPWAIGDQKCQRYRKAQRPKRESDFSLFAIAVTQTVERVSQTPF